MVASRRHCLPISFLPIHILGFISCFLQVLLRAIRFVDVSVAQFTEFESLSHGVMATDKHQKSYSMFEA
jgi:hypothetical protein